MDEQFKLVLQAALDIQKSRNSIDAQIKEISKTASKLELGITVDTKSAKQALKEQETIQDRISKTIAKRNVENVKLEENQAKAINKTLEQQYKQRLNKQKQDAKDYNNYLNQLAKEYESKDQRIIDAKNARYKKELQAQKQLQSIKTLGLEKSALKSNAISWLNANPKASNQFKGNIDSIIERIKDADKVTLTNLRKEFQATKAKAQELGMTGRTFLGELKNNIGKFASWFAIGGGIAGAVRSISSAVVALKDIDTQLTEISKTSELTGRQLKQLGNDAFDAANKYGATVNGYLTGVREMSRAGKSDATGLAEVSILAQSAGDMDAKLANKYLLATDAAYKLGGSAEKLTQVLDGQNQVTNRNAVDMTALAEATMVAGSQAAQSQVPIEKLTAAVGTMNVVTQQGGDIAGRAFKGILMNLQQVKGELEDGEIIDEESLSKYEKASEALGVSLKEVKNGIIALRDPMQILKELSVAFNALDESDARRANLISAVGGKYRGNEQIKMLTAPYVQKCA